VSAPKCEWCGLAYTPSRDHTRCKEERLSYQASRYGMPERGDARQLQAMFAASMALAIEDYRTLESLGTIRGTDVRWTVEFCPQRGIFGLPDQDRRHPVFQRPDDSKRDYAHVERAYRTVPMVSELVEFFTGGAADKVLDAVGLDMSASDMMKQAGIGQPKEGKQ